MTNWASRVTYRRSRTPAGFGDQSRLVLGVVLASLLVLVGAAVVIARGDAARAIAEDARLLTWSESVGSSAAVLRGEVREGLVIAQSVAAGVFGQQAADDVADRIRLATDDLSTHAQELFELTGDEVLVASVETTISSADSIADALEVAEPSRALALAESTLATGLESLTRQTARISEEAAEHISAVNAGLGTITTAARFVSALLIPVLAVFLLYRAMRRSQKLSLLKSELARERELRHKKDAFLAAASHHIRTPLAAVVGFSELLRDRSRDFNAGVRTEVTELLAIEARETANVVDDLLAAARYDLDDLELREEPIELRDVLDAAISDWAHTQRMRLTLVGNAHIDGDRRWLGHVFRNLLRNAASFGGEQINVDIETVSNKVIVQIADNGEPIPEHERHRIFELYYSQRQVEGLAPSLGLGLSVARRLARAMGGDLQYFRLDDRNVFELRLPGGASQSPARVLEPWTIDPSEGAPTRDAISKVIATGGPRVVYQPIVDLEARARGEHRVVGYEALARFESLTPPEWFNSASKLGLRLDLELACIAAAVGGFDAPESRTFLAVNLSDQTLHSSRLGDVIQGIDPHRLVLELSEAASIRSYEETTRVLDALTARGIRLAIDDVGASEVDLWHIVRLDAQVIKLDMSLVRELQGSPHNRALIRSVVALAQELGTLVVAEGVENEDENVILSEFGVRFGQGFLYGKPDAIAAISDYDETYRAS